MKPTTLPVYYYLDHFVEMLEFVERTYDEILSDEDRAFTSSFRGLSKDAQCLLIRMVNRRGTIFNRALFKYPEITDLESAARNLIACGYARGLRADDYSAFLLCQPKTALLDGARAAGFGRDIRASWSKPALADFFLATIPFDVAAMHCGAVGFIALDNTRSIDFLLYLYFGKTADSLKNFALRDLGVLRTNKETSFSSRFVDADEAHACFHYSQVLNRIEARSVDIYQLAVKAILDGPPRTSDYAADLASRAACQVGQYFEKQGELDVAERLYRFGQSADCRERLVRLLYTRGEKDAAELLLREMIDDPESDDEHLFAMDFYARKFGKQRTGLSTALLRSGRLIVVDDTHRGHPEAGVAGVLRRRGGDVYFAENTLWLTLFGLLFWDELFESGQLNSLFDWVPHCLRDRTFHRRFAAQIDAKLAQIKSGQGLPIILRVVASKWGRSNGLFAWEHVQIDALRALLACANADGLAAILRAMCEDFCGMRDGFPDLMQVRDGKVTFVEVKAEGDAIRRNQLTRLRQLEQAGIPAEIGRVDYRFDPEQDYVVVDIETTGSWSSGDRITEIGAVKVRNHQLVEQWHSLINPQRPIPAKIVELTGITNQMVRDAPVFHEIADSFMAFMGDGIFVAHNVNFDYGFLSSEFERLERRFRFPKLCTCVGMRRRYPGHTSYGLGKLCAIYGIELDDHHRALCDARAAAHLLNLINTKRVEEAEADAVQAA
uniref:exonuclease domain-containing protein n=1 Tax=Bradyrhizobium sp. (strain ORS 278) TaxID=114615 RepID=UPI00059F348D|nr:exonuclease domain-containing protein [Bradyrhizobium sp. ORS 278]